MRTVLLLLCVGLAAGPGCRHTPPVPADRPAFEQLTPIVEAALPDLGGNAGLVLLHRDGTVLYKRYFGTYTDNTYIPIASGSKWLSMAVLMALVEDPALDIGLDDKVAKLLPAEFSASDRSTITLRQLMSHTSGLAGASPWLNADGITVTQAARGIGQGGTLGGAAVPAAPMPHGPAGSRFAYGGVGMQVAGGMAEIVTGKTWDVLFKERIAGRCAMPGTSYAGLGPTTNYRIAGGAGTRMMEYANFLLMLLNDGRFNGVQVLQKASVEEMLRDQTNGLPLAETPYESDLLRKDFRYGLGCWIEETDGGEPAVLGCQGAFGFSPWIDRKRGVAGILFVRAGFGTVNTRPTPQAAPYTQIRQKVAQILDAP